MPSKIEKFEKLSIESNFSKRTLKNSKKYSNSKSSINHHALQPAIRIGKSGITDNVVKQIITIMKKKRVIKVKFLPSAIQENKKELVKELAERTRTRIVHKVGFIVVLERLR